MEVYHSAGTTTTAVLIQSTTALAAHSKAAANLTGARRGVDTGIMTITKATREMGVATLHLQEGGCRPRPEPRASELACPLHPRQLVTTVMGMAMAATMAAEAIRKATAVVAVVADTVRRLRLHMAVDNIKVEVEVEVEVEEGTEEGIKVKAIGSHHQATMIVGTEEEEEVVIGDMIGDTATIKDMETIGATVVEVKGKDSFRVDFGCTVGLAVALSKYLSKQVSKHWF